MNLRLAIAGAALLAGLGAANAQPTSQAGGTPPDQTAPAAGAIIVDRPLDRTAPPAAVGRSEATRGGDRGLLPGSPAERRGPSGSQSAADARYRRDVARCERLGVDERRDCLRDAGTARADGLYRN